MHSIRCRSPELIHTILAGRHKNRIGKFNGIVNISTGEGDHIIAIHKRSAIPGCVHQRPSPGQRHAPLERKQTFQTRHIKPTLHHIPAGEEISTLKPMACEHPIRIAEVGRKINRSIHRHSNLRIRQPHRRIRLIPAHKDPPIRRNRRQVHITVFGSPGIRNLNISTTRHSSRYRILRLPLPCQR